jgi:serine/threonine-protein kinase ULK/ATG1
MKKFEYTFDENTDLIGRGTFSRVYLGTRLNDASASGLSPLAHKAQEGDKDKVAIKVIELPKLESKNKHLLREIDVMRHLKHENIVSLYDIHYDTFHDGAPSGGIRLYIVMEYCKKGDLSEVPKPLHEEKCKEYFRGIAAGLYYLYKMGVVHRDVKPQNVLLTADDQVKIADFTFARHLEEQEMMQTMCGTPLYIAPEILNGNLYDSKCDVWSFGVMLYQYLYSSHPLGSVKSQVDLIRKMRTTKINFPQKLVLETYEKLKKEDGDDDDATNNQDATILCRTIHHFSPEVIELLKGILSINPRDRLGWDQVLQSPWIRKGHECPFKTPTADGGSNEDSGDSFGFDSYNVVSGKTSQSFSAPPTSSMSPPPYPLAPRFVKTRSSTKTIPKRIPAQTPPNNPLATTPISPTENDDSATSGEDGLFKMSDERKGGGSASRLIADYCPRSQEITTTSSSSSHSTTTTNPTHTNKLPQRREKQSSLLARSLETLQKVFY